MKNSMGMKGKDSNQSPKMADADNNPVETQAGNLPTSISPTHHTSNSGPTPTGVHGSLPSSASAPSNLYRASVQIADGSNSTENGNINERTAVTPEHSPRPLTSGPRPHPVHHPDRPNSAPPHHLERLSGALLRSLGDNYNTNSLARSWRFLGDQMAFESDVRRALSYSDLNTRVQGDKKH